MLQSTVYRFVRLLKNCMQRLLSCTLFCLASLALTTYPSAAQVDCSRVLIVTQISASKTVVQELSYYHLIQSESDFRKAKEAGGDFKYGLIEGSANYSEFRQERERLFRELGFSMSLLDSQRVVTSFVPKYAVKAWKDCVLVSKPGIVARVFDLTEKGATIGFSIDPGTSKSIRIESLDLRGVSTNKEEIFATLGEDFGTEKEEGYLIVDRVEGQDLRLIVKAGTFAEKLFIQRISNAELPARIIPEPSKTKFNFGGPEGSDTVVYIPTGQAKVATLRVEGITTFGSSDAGASGQAQFSFEPEIDGTEDRASTPAITLNPPPNAQDLSAPKPFYATLQVSRIPLRYHSPTGRLGIIVRNTSCKLMKGDRAVPAPSGQSLECFMQATVSVDGLR